MENSKTFYMQGMSQMVQEKYEKVNGKNFHPFTFSQNSKNKNKISLKNH